MIKQVFSMPGETRVYITDFAGGFRGTITELKKEFRKRLQQKITSHIDQTGRKFDSDYQRNMHRDCRAINDYFGRRIIARGTITTDFLRKRYGHRFLLDI